VQVVHSVNSFTAHGCNRLLGRQGTFWQHESYDHWVRDDGELERIVDYIAWNPVKAGLVGDGRVLDAAVAPTDAGSGPDGIIAALARLGKDLAGGHTVAAAGIAVKGIVDPHAGALLDVNEAVSSLIGLRLAELAGQALGLPICIENDARMYALGELVHGAGRASQNMVCMTLGTGIGTSVVVDRVTETFSGIAIPWSLDVGPLVAGAMVGGAGMTVGGTLDGVTRVAAGGGRVGVFVRRQAAREIVAPAARERNLRREIEGVHGMVRVTDPSFPSAPFPDAAATER